VTSHVLATPRFVRIDGATHLCLDSEHVLCHTATSDAADSEGDESLRWHETTKQYVTCHECSDIILLCRHVVVRRGTSSSSRALQ
jgi:hypothetical protein